MLHETHSELPDGRCSNYALIKVREDGRFPHVVYSLHLSNVGDVSSLKGRHKGKVKPSVLSISGQSNVIL